MALNLYFIKKLNPLISNSPGFFNPLNTNMQDRKPTIKAYKWINNEIHFVILDLDRKRVPLAGKTLYITLYNPYNNEIIFKKSLEIVDQERSIAKLVLEPGEMLGLSEKDYRFVITFESMDSDGEYVLFTDQTWSCYGNFFLDNAHIPKPKDSYFIENEFFTPYQIQTIPPKTVYATSAIKLSNNSPLWDGITTWQVTLDNWFGTIYVIGTHDETPPNMLENWMLVEEYVFTNPFTGVFWDNLDGKFTYIRLYYENNSLNQGTLVKMAVR